MEWNDESEQQSKKKETNVSSKILLALIVCVIIIIVLLLMLLMASPKETTYSIYVDGKVNKTTSKDNLLTTIDDNTYINIEEFAKLVGYEYHNGEYKSYIAENNKCHVEGEYETATFYLNDNKIYKLPINELEKEYEEYIVENPIKSIDGKFYASMETINIAFNVIIEKSNNAFSIYTLEYLISIYDANIQKWGYTSIKEESFENKKALLYGYIVVKKDLYYKVIDLENTKEIIPARYSDIEFSENMQSFIVTSATKKMGIVNLDGTTKIEPRYESISMIDKELDLYLVQQSQKYGVVNGKDFTIVYPEYDSIGITNNSITNSENKYLILNTLIPVCKEEKWGAYDKNGKIILPLEYDDLGYTLNNIEINGMKKSVIPTLSIERCKGIVVKKEEKYGLIDCSSK